MARHVRCCITEDGVRIAYSTEGNGPPLVICPYFFESFARDGDTVRAWPDLLQGIGAGRQVLRYDVRGTGLSQRDAADISNEAFLLDLEAVVQAAGLDTFDLLGWTTTGPLAIEYAARNPEKVKRLVL